MGTTTTTTDDTDDAANDDSDYNSDAMGSPDGGFLTRTDTNRDRTGGTIREFKNDWVQFEDGDDPEMTLDDGGNGGGGVFTHKASGDPFRTSFFSQPTDDGQSAIDELFASTNSSLQAQSATKGAGQQKVMKKVKRIKGGIGNVLNRGMTQIKKAKGRRSRTSSKGGFMSASEEDDAFAGIADVAPVTPTTTNAADLEMTPTPTGSSAERPSKQFDALNFEEKRARKAKEEKAAASASAVFGDMFGDEAVQQKETQKQQKQNVGGGFGDLFGDFSTNGNEKMSGAELWSAEPVEKTRKVSDVKDVMKGAYGGDKKVVKTATLKNASLFDDLF